MAEAKKTLKLFSKSTLSSPTAGKVFSCACNPVFDIVATVSRSELCVWRANEQMVAKHEERDQSVGACTWKEDGQVLAAGWSDGTVRLVGLENSKSVHKMHVVDGSSPEIVFIAWSRNSVGRRDERDGDGRRRKDDWQQMLPHDLGPDEKQAALDLPHELTFLEIDEALPKISPLPVSGGSGDDIYVFSTRASLDFVLCPFDAKDTDSVDVMLVGTGDGGLHLSICNSFVIGSFKKAGKTTKKAKTSQVLQLCGHGSRENVSTHFLLLRPGDEEAEVLHLVPMDLTFVHSSPVNLSLLASKTTTLQNLLRYIKQTQVHMVSEFKSTRELPGRFLEAVEGDLKKAAAGPTTVVQALYHTLVTGHVYPSVQEWLVEGVAERGHKRWDKAVVTGLENLRGLVHENFLPALERCAMMLSRLLGLARFHASRESIGFTATQITSLLDIVSCLTLVGHKMLVTAMEELQCFRAFSTWLRFQIDSLATPSLAEELTEREAGMENEKVLEYMRRYLVESPLDVFLGDVALDDYAKDWDFAEDGVSRLDMLDKQLRRQALGQAYMKGMTKVDFLANYLNKKAGLVFADIAQAEKRNVRFGQATELSIGRPIQKHHVRVCARGLGAQDVCTFTAVIGRDESQNTVYVFKTQTRIVNGISSAPTTEICSVQLVDSVVDVKFLDDKALLVLCYAQGSGPVRSEAMLLRVPYQSDKMSYVEYRPGLLPEPLKFADREYRSTFMPMGFADESLPRPMGMDVQPPSTARGSIPARVCLLGEDGKAYHVYSLPEDWEEASWTVEPDL